MGDLTSNVALLNIKENKGSCGINFRYPINWKKEEFFNNLIVYYIDNYNNNIGHKCSASKYAGFNRNLIFAAFRPFP